MIWAEGAELVLAALADHDFDSDENGVLPKSIDMSSSPSHSHSET